jgi:hypothetical protein
MVIMAVHLPKIVLSVDVNWVLLMWYAVNQMGSVFVCMVLRDSSVTHA